MLFNDYELKWLEKHKDLINKNKFKELFDEANKPHSKLSVIESMSFPSKINYALLQAGFDIFLNDEVPARCFWNCKELTSIKLRYNITNINDGAFQSCTNLKSIKLPAELKNIGRCAFENSGLTEIKLPKVLDKIGTNAFYRCFDLKDVYTDVTVKMFKASLERDFYNNHFPDDTTIHCVDKIFRFGDEVI